MAHRAASDLDRSRLARKLLAGNSLGGPNVRGKRATAETRADLALEFYFSFFDRHWMGCLELRGTARKLLQAGHRRLRRVQRGPSSRFKRDAGMERGQYPSLPFLRLICSANYMTSSKVICCLRRYLGVSPKQKKRARQTFMKSATYAGFIDQTRGPFC